MWHMITHRAVNGSSRLTSSSNGHARPIRIRIESRTFAGPYLYDRVYGGIALKFSKRCFLVVVGACFSHPVYQNYISISQWQVMNAEQRQTADDLWKRPTDLSYRPTCRRLAARKVRPTSPFIITQPESWYSFYHIPQRVEGWVHLDGWLHV